MNRSTRRRRLLALGLVPALAFTAGCGKASEKLAEKAAERALEDAGGGNVDIGKDGSIKIETEDGVYETDGDGNFRVETDDGVSIGGSDIPDGWPEDVPVPESTVSYGASSPDGLMVTLTVDGSAGDVYDDIKASLDGWDVEDEYSSSSAGSEMRTATFKKGARTLTVSAADNGEGGSGVTMVYAEDGGN